MTSKRNYCMPFEYDPQKMARAYGAYLPISTKHATNVCRFIKGMEVKKALRVLDEVINLKRPVPYFRHRKDLAHKPGIGPGRYPVKACIYIKKVIENAINNAKQKGLDINKLKILHICAHKAVSDNKRRRYGYKKRTHIEVVLGVSE